MMDFYNQIKANTRNNNTSHTNDAGTSSSIPTTNAQYRYRFQKQKLYA